MKRAAHAAEHDSHGGRMMGDRRWKEGARNVRRLGVMKTDPEQPAAWVGFAGLARTVVERLVEEGGGRDEDRAAERPISDVLADVPHVLGGECTAVNVAPLITCLGNIERLVRLEGGVASALHGVVTHAREHLSQMQKGAPGHRQRTDAWRQGWEAVRQLMACDVPAPAPPLAYGMTDEEVLEACRQRDKRFAALWHELIECAHDMRAAWLHAATPAVTAHRAREDMRGLMRVLLRAWREVTDDVRAGAAKWEQQWEMVVSHPLPAVGVRVCECGYRTGERVAMWWHRRTCSDKAQTASPGDTESLTHHTLAKRLAIPDVSAWQTEAGWRIRVLLKWQRLVRAGKVKARRRRSQMWLAAEQERRRALTEAYAQQTARQGD